MSAISVVKWPILPVVILGGCVLPTAPEGDVGFAETTTVQQLAGCYRNLGQGGKNGPRRYLSQVLWPGTDADHEGIEVIRVAAVSDDSLRVTGETSGKILREGIFIEGRDFALESGTIKIKNSLFGSLAGEPGNVFMGAGHGSVTLGLDERGDGRLNETDTFAGTAFLIIPVGGQVRDSTRFEKLTELCGDI